MAELVFKLDDVSLTARWSYKLVESFMLDGIQHYTNQRIYATAASATRTVAITGIPDGENVKRAMLTANVSFSGDQDSSGCDSSTFTVKGLNFYTGSRKMDTSEFANETDWSANFNYYCDLSNGVIDTIYYAIDTEVALSSTATITDITLTLTTGAGAAFDGEIGSLPEGTKILIDEPDGVQGTYSIVHHGYGDTTLCLLWRDNCVATTSPFNHNEDTFLASNYGLLDQFLNTTFYEGLPDTTKPYIQLAKYPTRDKRYNGTVTELERYVCTPSVRELEETTGYEEWYGFPFDYLDTMSCGEIYWTRSISSTTGMSYRVNASGTTYTNDRSYPSGVRPCFCVLEEQLVTPATRTRRIMCWHLRWTPLLMYI